MYGCTRQVKTNANVLFNRKIIYGGKLHMQEGFLWLISIFYMKQPRNTRAGELYSRSQLLHELKDVLDVFRGLLPHVVGLLTTHVCARSDWDRVERGEWVGEERHVNTALPSNNPILMSRLPHHHNHKAHSWIIRKSWGSRLRCVRRAAQTVWGSESLSGAQKVSALI